ncbi:hypothetical protein KM789_11125 [Clostridium tyrobutyricum]|nr:hypothetical protein [Clostridium tyrobutyricum]
MTVSSTLFEDLSISSDDAAISWEDADTSSATAVIDSILLYISYFS